MTAPVLHGKCIIWLKTVAFWWFSPPPLSPPPPPPPHLLELLLMTHLISRRSKALSCSSAKEPYLHVMPEM